MLHHNHKGDSDMNKETLVLAHYYVEQATQKRADIVGDSLELAMKAVELQPERIVFAGVRFMSETVKMMLPNTEVILPHKDSTCSLVTQTDVDALRSWRERWTYNSDRPSVHIMYINSSAEMKTIADVIVTSRNVEEICQHYADKGWRILFSPDRNMGAYLKYIHPEWEIEVWDAVCEVHDKFKEEEINAVMNKWSDGPKFLLAHPESPLPVLKRADVVGSTSKMLQWVKDYPINPNTRAQVYVATEEGLLHNMRALRDDIDILGAPMYNGCQCSVCPYMKLNTPELVQQAILGTAGIKIDYMSDELMKQARKPVEKMMEFNK